MPKFFAPPLVVDPFAVFSVPQGRLTLTTNTPVLTATVSASATVRYTPADGNKIPIWNGVTFEMITFTELVNTLSDATTNPAAGAAAKVYDLFVGRIAGALTLVRDVAWTNDTTPVGSSTTPRAGLTNVQGILVNENAITNGFAAGYGTFVGTIRTDAGGATVSLIFGASGTAAFLGVWNMYNRTEAVCRIHDATASWTYSSATVRQMNGSAINQVSFIRGLNEDVIEASLDARINMPAIAATGCTYAMNIVLDATNALAGPISFSSAPINLAISVSPRVVYRNFASAGFHFLSANEQADGTNSITVQANSGAYQGLFARIKC